MRAALLWTTLLFGAPLPAGAAPADPAGEVDAEYLDLAEIAARVIRLGAPLLDTTNRDAFFDALDTAVLKLDFSSLALETLHETTLREIRRNLDTERAEALLEFEATVGPSWRSELRAGVARASVLTEQLVEHPSFVQGLHALTHEEAPTVQQILGDPTRPLEQRQAFLRYLRGFLCAGALAAAAEDGICMSDQLAELIIPRWRDSLEQLETVVRTGSFDPPDPDASLDLSPIAELMLRFQCRDGERLARQLQADASLASLLLDLREQVPRFFPEAELGCVTLGSASNPDGEAEEPALIVALHTSQTVPDAELSLDRFDRGWWLDRSLQAATRVVVDVRFS